MTSVVSLAAARQPADEESLWSLAQRERLPRKVVWRLCRQFLTPAEACRDQPSPELAEQIAARLQWSTVKRHEETHITKLLLRNAVGVQCEAVALFPDGNRPHAPQPKGRTKRAAVCISSQPGCGVGCPFCSTGQLGYRGNLTAAEIVEQVYLAGIESLQRDRQLKNIVFMGMGEPLHNREAVFQAIEWLTSERLFGFPPRRITLSTAGVPGGMIELARHYPEVRIALSLHAADPTLRRQLVPRAVADLRVLRGCIREVNQLQPKQPLWLEVVLFYEQNDTPEHARKLIEFCRGLCVEINLIPYNQAANSERFQASPAIAREAFAKILREAGIRTTFRTSLGRDSAAACGQLQAQDLLDIADAQDVVEIQDRNRGAVASRTKCL